MATRAVTIAAPPAQVWKWILQIGSARAGWYSLDLLDNGNVPSSREILPEFQKIEIGYFVPFTPDQKNGMWVKDYQEVEKATAGLMIANGVVSIVGGIVTAWSLGWVLTMPGVVSYVGWNILVLALSILMIISLRKRQTTNGST